MRAARTSHGVGNERGVALLIALFVLVLISGIAISLIVSAGTESSLAGNYRQSTSTFLAAMGGGEEGRERLMPQSPDSIVPCPVKNQADRYGNGCNSDVARMQALTASLQGFFDMRVPASNKAIYLINPASGDLGGIDPTSVTNAYYDSQLRAEFPPPAPLQQNAGLSTMGSPNTTFAVPYKWVRVTLKTEASSGIDYNNDGNFDPFTPIFYDATKNHQRLPCCTLGTYPGITCNSVPGLCSAGMDEIATEDAFLAQLDKPALTFPTLQNQPAGAPGVPVYRVTALAAGPSGTQRLVQFEVTRFSSVNAQGAVVSEAAVTTNGSFQVFGGYPPKVGQTCKYNATGQSCTGGSGCTSYNLTLCATFTQTGALTASCPATLPLPAVRNNPVCCKDANNNPTPCGDYCGSAPATNGIASGGSITVNGSNSQVPSPSTSCAPNQTCISTVAPASAIAQSQVIPYDLDAMVEQFSTIGIPATSFCSDGRLAPCSGGATIPVTCTTDPMTGIQTCGNATTLVPAQFGQLPNPYPPASGTTPPYPGNQPVVVYNDGNMVLTSHSKGSGILVVNGDLQLNAGFQWFGLIVVKGVVSFGGGGGATAPTNIIGAVLAGQNVLNNNTTLSGGVNIVYDSCAFNQDNGSIAYRVLSFREVGATAK